MRRALLLLTFLTLSSSLFGRWQQATGLTGGSIVVDVIEFKGSLYLTTNSTGTFRLNNATQAWEKLDLPLIPNFAHMVVHNEELLIISYGTVNRTTDGVAWTDGVGPQTFINNVSSDGATIVVATLNGIYLSSDAGVTWSLASDPQVQTEMIATSVIGNSIWASANSPAGTLFHSSDGGVNWTQFTKGTNPIRQIFMKGTDVFICQNETGVFKSSDEGANWEQLRNFAAYRPEFYASATTFYLYTDGRLSISSNDGSTWTDYTDTFSGFNTQTLFGTSLGVYLGTWGGGVIKTSSTENAPWEPYNEGLTIQGVNELATSNLKLFSAGTYSFVSSSTQMPPGSWLHEPWTQHEDAYGFKGATATAMIFHAAILFVGQGGSGVHRSDDLGMSWQLKNQGLVDKVIVDFASLNQDLFVATGDGVYKSSDYGNTWAKKNVGNLSGALTLYSDCKYLDCANLLLGTFDGLYLSKDVGETWSKINNGGIPDGGVPYVTRLDSTLFAGTQFSGIFKTNNLGQSWTHLDNFSTQPVQYLEAIDGVLFASTLDSQLYTSYDKGETWHNVGGGLGSGIVRAIVVTEFADNAVAYVAVGTSSSGVWLRPRAALTPPYLTFFSYLGQTPFSIISDSTFDLGEPIAVHSDQAFSKSDGTPMTNNDVADYFSVNTPAGPADFTATMVHEKWINVTVTNAVPGVKYVVTMGPVTNSSHVSKPAVASQIFTAFDNEPPVATNVSVSGDQDEPISLAKNLFEDAFTDEDGDALAGIIVKTLPQHGYLSGGSSATLSPGSVILVNELCCLWYVPAVGYVGVDAWIWSGHDGIESSNDATVIITVNEVVGVQDSEPIVTMYPVPVKDMLYVQHPVSIADVAVTLYSTTGARLPAITTTMGAETLVDMSGFVGGLYVVKVESEGKVTVRKVWK